MIITLSEGNNPLVDFFGFIEIGDRVHLGYLSTNLAACHERVNWYFGVRNLSKPVETGCGDVYRLGKMFRIVEGPIRGNPIGQKPRKNPKSRFVTSRDKKGLGILGI